MRYGGQDPAQFRSEPVRFSLSFDNKRSAAKARTRSDLECLTQAVYYEARGESPRGQFAVAQVVMNRVKHPAFPKSVCAVVFQGAGRRGCQFSFACDGSMRGRREAVAWLRAKRVATRALAGAALADIGSATHFHTTGVSPIWAPHMLRVSQVGMHVFYRFSPRKLQRDPALPEVEKVMLTSGPAGDALKLTPAVATAVDASLGKASPPTPAPEGKPKAETPPQAAPEPKPAEAALLATPGETAAGGA